MALKSASYSCFTSASDRASAAARGSSKKTDTKPELLLRKALWKIGLRYRKNLSRLQGKPDIVFPGSRVVVFCDGDFWHGKDWATRRQKLAEGANSAYWILKIESNISRDRKHEEALTQEGWLVMRFWESEILHDLDSVVATIEDSVRSQKADVLA